MTAPIDARAVIVKIRQGDPPSSDELLWFTNGLANGAVTDAQAGAFAMAVLLKGLGEAGRVALTRGMRDSGQVLRWDLPGPVIDIVTVAGNVQPEDVSPGKVSVAPIGPVLLWQSDGTTITWN